MPDFKTKFKKLDPIMSNFVYRRQITLIAGAPLAGKTTSMFKKIAVPLATGTEDLLGEVHEPKKVLMCSERDWESNSEQMTKLGIKALPENVKMFCYPDLSKADKTKFMGDPLGFVAEYSITSEFKPDLTILDTAQLFQSRPGSSTINDYTSARREMAYVKDWATYHNTAVIAAFHAPKQNAKNEYEDPFNKILGSTAYLAAAIAAAVMERCSDSCVRIHFRSHLDRLESPRYFRYGDFEEIEEAVALTSDLDKGGTKLMTLSEREAQYLNLVPYDPAIFADLNRLVCKELDIELNNGRNISHRLESKGLVFFADAPESGERIIRRNRLA